MNTNLRALVFGTAVAAALTITLDSVVAAEPVQVVQLEGITVTAHRDAPEVVQLDPVFVVAHKSAAN